MKPSIQQIKNLNDQAAVSLLFSDGCAMDVRIVETMHLDEGEDFVAEVLTVKCNSIDHWHASPGDYINIRLADIVSFDLLEESNRTQQS